MAGQKSKQGGPSTKGGVVTALLYTRVSSDEQEKEGLSLAAQTGACRRYAAEHGWMIGAQYTDVLSGKRDDRPQYQALLTHVRQLRADGHAAVVVVAWLHRFGRRVLERVRCREELKALGVATHSIKEGGEVSDLIANILASVAEEETRQLGERVRETNAHARSLGWHAVGWVPWGYQWRDATPEERALGAPKRVLREDEIAAPYVREMFARAAKGDGIAKLRKWLITVPARGRNNRAMGGTNISKRVRSPIYIGRDSIGADDVLSRPLMRWPALVDEATWLQAQASIDSHQHQARQANGRYLLTGFLRCPKCGAGMCGQWFRADRRYVCIGHRAGTSAPDPTCRASASGRQLDRGVLAQVDAVLAAVPRDPALMVELRREWKRLSRPPEDSETGRRLKWLDTEIAESTDLLRRATDLYVAEKIPQDQYDDKCQRERERIATNTAERSRLAAAQTVRPQQLPPLDDVLRRLERWSDALTSMDTQEQRQALAEIVVRVVATRTSVARYDVKVEQWTPLAELLRQIGKALAFQPATVAA